MSRYIESDLAVAPDLAGVTGRTVVAIAPSDADAYTDRMRVAISGKVILRDFDPGAPIVTGAPIALVTMGGEPLVTMSGEALVTMVIS